MLLYESEELLAEFFDPQIEAAQSQASGGGRSSRNRDSNIPIAQQ